MKCHKCHRTGLGHEREMGQAGIALVFPDTSQRGEAASNRSGEPRCQRQSKSEPEGRAKCCRLGVGIVAAWIWAAQKAASSKT